MMQHNNINIGSAAGGTRQFPMPASLSNQHGSGGVCVCGSPGSKSCEVLQNWMTLNGDDDERQREEWKVLAT